MLRMDLLIEKLVANKQSDLFLRIPHNICKITLILRYISYIYISYQMYKTWSCVTYCHSLNRFPQANDNCISTYWKWFGIEVYTRSTWFHFELNLSYLSRFFWKKPCKMKKFHKNCFYEKEKSWTNFKIFQKNTKISKLFEPL